MLKNEYYPLISFDYALNLIIPKWSSKHHILFMNIIKIFTLKYCGMKTTNQLTFKFSGKRDEGSFFFCW
jgi:hypothetical protein